MVRKGRPRRAELRQLHQQIAAQRDVVECTQRAIARARHTIVAAQCRVLRFSSARDRAANQRAQQLQRIAAVVGRLEQSHKRLLRLSADVERESDRLDIACAAIARLPGPD